MEDYVQFLGPNQDPYPFNPLSHNAPLCTQFRGGFIGGGGCTGVCTPVGLGQQGCKGGAKNQIQKYGTIFPFY